MQVTWSKCYSNFDHGITAVCQEILCFAEVDPHHADEQMAGCPQTDFHLSGEQKSASRPLDQSAEQQFKCVFTTCGEMMSLTVDSRLHSNTCALVSFLSQ